MPHLALLSCGLAGVLLVAGWLVTQMRLTRRRLWANEVATAMRIGDAARVQGLLERIPPWASGLDEVLHEARTHFERLARQSAELSGEVHEAQRIFQEAPLALLLLDARGRIEQANRRALVLLERTSTELHGRSLSEFGVLREERPRPGPGRPSPRACLLELDRLGSADPIQIWDAAPRSEQRRIVAALEEGPLARERAEPQSDLEAIGRFAGSVAHDFNDLLTAVLGRASVMISECEPGSALHKDLAEIVAAGEQARLLTHQLMALSRQGIVGRTSYGRAADPARSSAPAEILRAPQTEAPVPARSTPATICVVEDDEAVRRFVATVLEREGHAVLAAGSSQECIELCRAHAGTIDLLVSDVHMPSMYGPELYLDLLQTRPDLEAVFMSGYVERELFLADQGRRSEFLQKPFTALELVTVVRAALQRRERSRPARVLVIGDQRGALSELSAHLRSLGVHGVLARDGRDALAILQGSRFDAVLCALAQRDADGIEICAEILRRWPRTRLVALAGRNRGGDHLAIARNLGAVAELLEPFSKDELAIALEKALASDPDRVPAADARTKGAA